MSEAGIDLPQATFSHKALFSGREVKVVAPREAVMQSWLSNISDIKNALNTPSSLKTSDVWKNKEGRYFINPATVKDIVENEHIDEEGKQLLSVGLFILREKPKWKDFHGKVKGLGQELFGGTLNLETLPLQETVNCIETAVWAKTLANQYNIVGDVKREGFLHSYFQAESGKIVDVMEGWRRGGMFQSEEEYLKYVDEKRKAEKKRHNSFNASK